MSTAWLTFWTAFLVLTVGAFAALAVVVGWRGFFEARALLAGESRANPPDD